jgi:glycosyltransferase involved in cell wall biosynthesis
MRVGVIAPPWISVPPPAYGGTEAVVDNLARGLAARGHHVRLFTVGTSTCPVERAHLFARPAEPIGGALAEAAHVLAAYEAMTDVDVIHDHTTLGPLLGAGRPTAPPLVSTAHGPLTPETARVLAATRGRALTVAISQAQADSAAPDTFDAVIHHGVDLDAYRPGVGGGGYLMFVGRMCAAKGVHRAVRIAHRARMPLVIVAKMRERAERDYFEQEVQPRLRPADVLLVESSLAERVELLQHAEALINPIAWPEPFGLVMVEALACATPVLVYRRGAAPEIVDDGNTGFLCTDEDGMVAAVRELGTIGRSACRRAAERRFSLPRMAAAYENVYHTACARRTGRGTGGTHEQDRDPLVAGRSRRDRGGGDRGRRGRRGGAPLPGRGRT